MKTGILLVSHSRTLAEGAAELARQMARSDNTVFAVGGTEDGEIGTSALLIRDRLTEALATCESVLVLMDLGSAFLNTELALEMLPEEEHRRVTLSNAPLVEGALLAAIAAATDQPLEAVAKSAEEGRSLPKITR